MTMSMGGKLTRKIGQERNEAWWGLKNLTFHFLEINRATTMLHPRYPSKVADS